MNNVSNVWRCHGDPRVIGLSSMPGERCIDVYTGTVYVKQGTSSTSWILGTEAYGGGGGESSGNVDGGTPSSIYGGSIAIDGGGP